MLALEAKFSQQSWENPNVVSIHKEGVHQKLFNYRPVLLFLLFFSFSEKQTKFFYSNYKTLKSTFDINSWNIQMV